MLTLSYTAAAPLRLERLDPARVQLAVNRAAGDGMVLALKEHFAALPGRAFWGDAAKATDVLHATAQEAVVAVGQRGVALQVFGGTVEAAGNVSEMTGKPTRALLIPSKTSPLYLRRRPLHELGIEKERIHIIRSKNKKAYLVADTVKRVKLKPGEKNGRRRTKDKQTFIFLGSLRRKATIPPHPQNLPTAAEQTKVLERAAEQTMKGLGFTFNP